MFDVNSEIVCWKTRQGIVILKQGLRKHVHTNTRASDLRYLLLHEEKNRRQLCNEANSLAHTDTNKQVWVLHARTEPPAWCLPAPSSNQSWCIMRGTWLSEKPADLPCLDDLQHFQAHTGHWLEGLNSQPAVYQRSGTGNQFSNAVWAYSLQLWSTPRPADTDRNTHVPGHVSMRSCPQTEHTLNVTQMAIAKAEDNSQILTYQA